MLRRLRLQLPRRTDVGQQGHVQEKDIVTTHLVTDLPNRLEERQRLDISDGAPDLGDDDVHVRSGHPANPCFDLVRDVRNHLHGVAEVLTAAFLRDDGGVHLTRGDVRRSQQVGIQEAFVVPDIQVCFRTVVGDENLSVLERVHGPGIDVEIGIKLLHRDAQTARFQEISQRRRRQPLAQR